MQMVEIVGQGLPVCKFAQVDGSEITDRHFVFVRVLDDLSAQVGTFDRAEILLVGFPVAGIFIEHVGSSSLNLRVNNLPP